MVLYDNGYDYDIIMMSDEHKDEASHNSFMSGSHILSDPKFD